MNSRNILFVLTLILSFVWWTKSTNTTFRIFHGDRVTNITRYEYMAALYENQVYFCAGALVSYLHVVTAARCVYNKRTEDISVRAGVANLEELGELRVANLFYFPNDYNPATQAMGIAVVEVRHLFPTDNAAITPIRIWNSEMAQDTRLEVSGWGLINQQAEQCETELRTCSLYVKDWSQCLRHYSSANIAFPPELICAENRRGSNICYGDTGAPGVVGGHTLCAVAIGSVGCGRPEFPATFIDIGIEEVHEFLINIIPV